MAIKPVNKTRPVVSGIPAVNNKLTTTKGTWANLPTSYRYKWVKAVPVTVLGIQVTRNSLPVWVGAAAKIGTANSILLTALQKGFLVGSVVTALNAAGQASAASNMLKVT